MGTFARVMHMLVLALWFGAAVAVAVAHFALPDALGSAQRATEATQALLVWVDGFGLFGGPLLLVTLVTGWAPMQVPLRGRVLLTLAMTVTVGLSGQMFAPRLADLTDALGRPLEQLPATDPVLLEFDQVQTIVLSLLVTHLLLSLALLVAAVRSTQPKRRFGIEL